MRVVRFHELVLYAIGLSFFAFGAAGIILALYSTPYLIWGVSYDVPEFVIQFGIWFQQSAQSGKALQLFALLVPGFLAGSILMFIAYLIISWVDHRIRAHIYERAAKPPVEKGRVSQVIFITVVIILLAVVFWLVDYYLLGRGL